jgi:hypothetical protein
MGAIKPAKPLSAAIGKITTKSFEARGFAAVGIVTEWAAVVGEEVAALSWPERLKRDGTLRVRVAGPIAVELQHQEPQILERIATYYGYRAVTRLSYVQGSPPVRTRRQARPKPARLDSEQAATLQTTVGATRDVGLRSALQALGRIILAPRPAK